ncbi:hypothetical protein SAMN04487926_10667 [Paraburkholderia steynii]|uniref:JmjC domain-containing protein n=1 Tax=Paraburkholderia steynii TaxID=1245441 RepID=A0A7Z7FG93_9BURK|nr:MULTISPECIES: hypothetical protein [Paraburkholderia]BDC38593.1 hypothetical protein PTKU15_18900 [Paraburkholderia terrae]SDH61449.1 hypothetical protein SAMN04487926_10667 [Paraburkholderia steynii]
MIPSADSLLTVDQAVYKTAFNNTPFGFKHCLHQLSMFQPEALAELAKKYGANPADYYVSNSAPTPGTRFFDVKAKTLKPDEALAQLATGPTRVLLKRPENYDAGFRELLDKLFEKVVELRGGLNGEKVERLESGIFVSSASSTTPFHFDPEINHFFQIEGDKHYHVYRPSAVREDELEDFYVQGIVEIGQVDLATRDKSLEHVFDLVPGSGFHQPQDAPHWVQTGAERSVSYAVVYETDATRARGRIFAANHYLRKLGVNPQPPGTDPGTDNAKSSVMKVVVPVRRRIVRNLSRGR